MKLCVALTAVPNVWFSYDPWNSIPGIADRKGGISSMSTVGESVSKTVSKGYSRIMRGNEGIRWNNASIQAKYHQKKGDCGHESHPLRHLAAPRRRGVPSFPLEQTGSPKKNICDSGARRRLGR